MSRELHDALEFCLQEIERGADVETCLERFPEFATDLRPLLNAALLARSLPALSPSPAVMQRGRARLLQRAAEMRTRQERRHRRIAWGAFRSAAVAFLVAVFLFVSGTGLVRASSTALPGDGLYPVKRTWEGLRLSLVFDPLRREEVEFEIENERLEEIGELFAKGRVERVSFDGWLESRQADRWLVSGVTVVITGETRLPAEPVDPGAAVRIVGWTQPEKVVEATDVILLPPDAVVLPETEEEEGHDEHEGLAPPSLVSETPDDDDGGAEVSPTATLEAGDDEDSGGQKASDDSTSESGSGNHENHGGEDDSHSVEEDE
ncbi:MAG: hypothetical protein D6770_04960 [Anaerolineae bacterium]|nr:MAG: hypothetical protein D6770_04960 [Anaerolineae bacterium]